MRGGARECEHARSGRFNVVGYDNKPTDAPRLNDMPPPKRRPYAVDTIGHGANGVADNDGVVPSKTQRKAAMHALQDLGEALVELEPRRFADVARELALPERLVEAVEQARSIKAWGARRRQLQYIGKLMREVEAEPIRRRLEALNGA